MVVKFHPYLLTFAVQGTEPIADRSNLICLRSLRCARSLEDTLDLNTKARLVMARLNRQGRVEGLRSARIKNDLDQAVKRQRREFGIERVWIDVQRHRQARPLPDLLDLDVPFDALQFVLQRPDDAAGSVQDEPEKIRQLADDPIRIVRIRVDECGNRVERAVEKLRPQLAGREPRRASTSLVSSFATSRARSWTRCRKSSA